LFGWFHRGVPPWVDLFRILFYNLFGRPPQIHSSAK